VQLPSSIASTDVVREKPFLYGSRLTYYLHVALAWITLAENADPVLANHNVHHTILNAIIKDSRTS
jgi:hypothetical protein